MPSSGRGSQPVGCRSRQPWQPAGGIVLEAPNKPRRDVGQDVEVFVGAGAWIGLAGPDVRAFEVMIAGKLADLVEDILPALLSLRWSRIVDAFPIDRRALADRPDLGLTEDRIRGAIRTLEAVGLLDRAVAGGSTHKKTSDGELHRKPILFRRGTDYAPAFIAANRRAAAARGRHSGERRALAPSTP
jgi:hypothetical protein